MTVQEDCWLESSESDDQLEQVLPAMVARDSSVFIYQLCALIIGFGIFIALCSESIGRTMIMMYAICFMITLEQNFQDLGLDNLTRSYCHDFNLVMIAGLFLQFYSFNYLWAFSVAWLFYKHWSLISREMRKVPFMPLREWVLLGFLLMPLSVKILV